MSTPDFLDESITDETLALMGRNFSAHIIKEAFKRYKSSDPSTKLSMERAFINPIIRAAFAVKSDDDNNAAAAQAAEIRGLMASVLGGSGDTDTEGEPT